MLYRVTLAVDVEAGTITEAAAAAHKAVADSQRVGGQQGGAHVTRCEVEQAKKV